VIFRGKILAGSGSLSERRKPVFKFHIMPQRDKFFHLFKDSATNGVTTARLLKELVDDCTDVEDKMLRITEAEHNGDRFTREIKTQIHRTFVTPFDREDMVALADSLDDIVDFTEAAAALIHLYKIKGTPQKAKDLADVLLRGTIEVEKAVRNLEEKTKMDQILGQCEELHQLEVEADVIFRSAMAELFDNPTDLVLVIKWHEIYHYMEDATDRCDDAANVLEGVVIKHV
jgi:predicted phosphate transport protein (TIGR00153 family)